MHLQGRLKKRKTLLPWKKIKKNGEGHLLLGGKSVPWHTSVPGQSVSWHTFLQGLQGEKGNPYYQGHGMSGVPAWHYDEKRGRLSCNKYVQEIQSGSALVSVARIKVGRPFRVAQLHVLTVARLKPCPTNKKSRRRGRRDKRLAERSNRPNRQWTRINANEETHPHVLACISG